MSTKALRKLVEMFGSVPLSYYTTEKMDREAHEAWAAAKAELDDIENALSELRDARERESDGAFESVTP